MYIIIKWTHIGEEWKSETLPYSSTDAGEAYAKMALLNSQRLDDSSFYQLKEVELKSTRIK